MLISIFTFSVVSELQLSPKGSDKLAYIFQTSDATSSADEGDQEELVQQMKQYEMYKKKYARNTIFDPTKTELSKLNSFECL